METTPGKRLRIVRERLGYQDRQNDFAEDLGMSQQALSNMERDKGKPSFDSLQKIVEKFDNVNLAYLLTGEGQPLIGERALVERPATTSPPVTELPTLRVSKLNQLTAEEASDLIIENVRLKAELQAERQKSADLQADKEWLKELKKAEGNQDAAPFANPSSTPSMIPTACKPGAQPEATVVDMAAWVARKMEEQMGSVTLTPSVAGAA